jgi:dTDP-4-dehydrorhamnose 3,5-epimerase
MKITPTEIPEVLLIEPQVYADERGFFMETFQVRNYAEAGLAASFVQDNLSGSRGGVLRGLHYQMRQPQGKLVSVLVGEVFDVAVDLRRSSPTFGRWVGAHLSAQDRRQIWVPPGFGHGFLVLSAWAELAYKASDFYSPGWERTIRWDDPTLAIRWPLAAGQQPLLSPKDAQGCLLADADLFD